MSKPAFIAAIERDRSSLAIEVEAEVASYRHLSMNERGELISELCASAWAVLTARPDFQRALQWRDPPAPDFEDKWRSLVAAYRKANQ